SLCVVRSRPCRPVVAVKGVVAPADGGDPLRRKPAEVVRGRVRRDVTAVGEGVDPRPLLHPLTAGELEQRQQVLDVRVDATLRDEPEQVHVAVALPRTFERGYE